LICERKKGNEHFDLPAQVFSTSIDSNVVARK
jgi:hypothetical protein